MAKKTGYMDKEVAESEKRHKEYLGWLKGAQVESKDITKSFRGPWTSWQMSLKSSTTNLLPVTVNMQKPWVSLTTTVRKSERLSTRGEYLSDFAPGEGTNESTEDLPVVSKKRGRILCQVCF